MNLLRGAHLIAQVHDHRICETSLLSRASLDTMPAKRVQKLLFKSNDVVDVDFSSLRVDDWCDDLRAFEADCMEQMRVHKERALSDGRVLSPEPNARARGARELDAAGLFSLDAHEREFSVTISAMKQHVPIAWFNALIAFMEKYGTKGAISLERGTRDEHLHIQVMQVVTIRTASRYALHPASARASLAMLTSPSIRSSFFPFHRRSWL